MIQVNHVTVKKGSNLLLQPINVKLPVNQFVCFVGASGSGKTLLLKRLIGLLPSTLSAGGEVIFPEGRNWVLGRDIGYIPQQYHQSFVPFLTIKQTLQDVYRAHQLEYDTSFIDGLLQSFRLDEELLNRLPNQLSGGQLQRMTILTAVCLKPRLIVADELTTALDPVATRQLLDWLKKYQQQTAATVLFVTHELKAALHYADTLYIMKAGQLIDTITKETMATRSHPYTRTLFAGIHLEKEV